MRKDSSGLGGPGVGGVEVAGGRPWAGAEEWLPGPPAPPVQAGHLAVATPRKPQMWGRAPTTGINRQDRNMKT